MRNGYERTKLQRIEQLRAAAPFAQHRRWHLKRGITEPACSFCAPAAEMSSNVRTCLICGVSKELNSDNFRRSPNQRWRWQCKKCEGKRVLRWMKNHPEKEMLQAARSRARHAGLPFDITATDIVIPETCPVFGVKLQRGTREAHEWAPSLDRNKPELGYVRGNVRVISNKANRLKSDASLDEFRQLVAYLERL